MQTRKRAKSITFARKKTEEEPEETPVADQPKPVAETPVTTEEKAETVERRTLADKPTSSELSSTLPATSEEDEAPSTAEPEEPEKPAGETVTATPSNEFITDGEPEAAATPEVTEPAAEEAKPAETEPAPAAVEPPATDLSAEPSAPATPDLTPTQPAAPAESAFTIQNDDKTAVAETGGSGDGGKKRFGLYFFLVAFLAFILGLGAMAAVTYGWVNIPGLANLKLPANVQVPGLPGSQPTPTPVPTAAPVAATPTEKAVDLKAYTISVLNGSGVVGKAGDVKTSLTTAGFKVGTTGNADKSDYTKTEIAAKKSVDKDYLTKLQAELQKSFDVAEPSTAPDSDASDVTVTIGTSTSTSK